MILGPRPTQSRSPAVYGVHGDQKAVLEFLFEQLVRSFVDLLDRSDLRIGCEVLLAAVIEDQLRRGHGADDGSRQGSLPLVGTSESQTTIA